VGVKRGWCVVRGGVNGAIIRRLRKTKQGIQLLYDAVIVQGIRKDRVCGGGFVLVEGKSSPLKEATSQGKKKGNSMVLRCMAYWQVLNPGS